MEEKYPLTDSDMEMFTVCADSLEGIISTLRYIVHAYKVDDIHDKLMVETVENIVAAKMILQGLELFCYNLAGDEDLAQKLRLEIVNDLKQMK